MWQQVYNPLQAPVLSALVAAIPILFFLLGLTVLKLSGVRAALGALVLAVGVGAIVLGFLSGLWPIGWVVLMAVWLYRISVRAGNFDIVRSSISAITTDQRIQMLLIAYCFGGFLEGAAGFGIPVAICAALLVSLGFQPLRASVLALVGNVASGAYGAIGIPVSNGAEKGGVALAALSTDMVFVLQICGACARPAWWPSSPAPCSAVASR